MDELEEPIFLQVLQMHANVTTYGQITFVPMQQNVDFWQFYNGPKQMEVIGIPIFALRQLLVVI